MRRVSTWFLGDSVAFVGGGVENSIPPLHFRITSWPAQIRVDTQGGAFHPAYLMEPVPFFVALNSQGNNVVVDELRDCGVEVGAIRRIEASAQRPT